MKTMFPLLHSISNSLSKWIIRNARKQKLKEKGISLWYIISVVFFWGASHIAMGILCESFVMTLAFFHHYSFRHVLKCAFLTSYTIRLHHIDKKKHRTCNWLHPANEKKRVQFQVAVSIRTTSVDTKRKKNQLVWLSVYV